MGVQVVNTNAPSFVKNILCRPENPPETILGVGGTFSQPLSSQRVGLQDVGGSLCNPRT